MTTNSLSISIKLVAVLTGVAVPSLVFGRAVMALPLALAILLLISFPERSKYWRAVVDQICTPIGIMVIVTLALWLPSMMISPLPLRSMDTWVRVPLFIGLIVFLAAMMSERQEAHTLALKALMVTAAMATLFALCSLTFLPEALAFIRRSGWSASPYSGFSPPGILKPYSTLAVLMIPVLIWGGWYLGDRWRSLGVVNVVGLLVGVSLTHNRAAMAGLLAIMVVGVGVIMIKRRNLAVTVAGFASVSMAILAVMLWLYHTRGHIQPPAGAVAIVSPWLIDWQRQTIWAHAIDIGMRSPWFGNGINVVNLLPGAGNRMFTSHLNFIPSHPHNWLFEVFAETGAIGAFALVTLVITLCLKFIGEYLKSGNMAVLAALLVNVGYWGSGLLNVSFWSAWWQISYLLMTAFCLAGRPRLDQR